MSYFDDATWVNQNQFHVFKLESPPRVEGDYIDYAAVQIEDIDTLDWASAGKRELAKRRIELGNKLYGVQHLSSNTIVASRYLSHDWKSYPEERMFQPMMEYGCCYAYAGYIDKEFRGRGLFALLASRMFNDTNGQGFRSYSTVSNVAALRSKQSYGENLLFTVEWDADSNWTILGGL